jgi:hypothetical protein
MVNLPVHTQHQFEMAGTSCLPLCGVLVLLLCSVVTAASVPGTIMKYPTSVDLGQMYTVYYSPTGVRFFYSFGISTTETYLSTSNSDSSTRMLRLVGSRLVLSVCRVLHPSVNIN